MSVEESRLSTSPPKACESVLSRAASGDQAAFADCLDRYGNLVWRMARRMCRNHADAEEAVQDIFLALWRKARQYDPQRGSEAAFISTLAQRLLIDRHRAGRRLRLQVPFEDAHEAVLADERPTAAQYVDGQRAISAVERLKPAQREVLQLALLSGLSQKEIAQLTSTPLGTVKANMRRGFLAVAKVLNNNVRAAPVAQRQRTAESRQRKSGLTPLYQAVLTS